MCATETGYDSVQAVPGRVLRTLTTTSSRSSTVHIASGVVCKGIGSEGCCTGEGMWYNAITLELEGNESRFTSSVCGRLNSSHCYELNSSVIQLGDLANNLYSVDVQCVGGSGHGFVWGLNEAGTNFIVCLLIVSFGNDYCSDLRSSDWQIANTAVNNIACD